MSIKQQVPECMLKYQSEFIMKFGQIFQKDCQSWLDIQNEQRLYLVTGAWWFYLGAFAAGFIPGKHETNYLNNLQFHFWIGIVLFIVMIFIQISIANSEYQDQVKKKLFPKLLKVFSNSIKYSKTSGMIKKGTFIESELFKKNVCAVHCCDTQDAFGGEYNNVEFKICETNVDWNNGEIGKQREEKTLFDGLAMHFLLEKNINSIVHIYSKSIFNKAPKGFEKVEIEYEKFNKKYDVYVKKSKGISSQIEARYLLNVAFLERLLGIQTGFRVSKMKCSVFGNEMLILLDTRKDLFEMNHLFKSVKDPNQYKHLFNEFASVFSFIDVLNLSSKTGL